jgi:hypothetical protein
MKDLHFSWACCFANLERLVAIFGTDGGGKRFMAKAGNDPDHYHSSIPAISTAISQIAG